MRVLYGVIIFFTLFLLARSDAEREKKRLRGNLLMKGDSGVCYDGIGLTESYLVLLTRGCNTIIQVFDRDDLSHLYAFALKGHGATYFSNPEFMKSNTKELTGKDGSWIVDNQLTFNKIQILADSLRFDQKYILVPELIPSTHYNVTTEEVYAVPIVEENVYGPFCYTNREEGIYWVEPPKVAKTYRSYKHVACLSNLCVNERQNSTVAALRFFNQISSYDLKGTYQRSFTYGKEPIVPLLRKNDTQADVPGTAKCFIDIFDTNQYVHCLYDGSVDSSNLSTLLVFSWDDRLKERLSSDHSIKGITVNPSDCFLVVLTLGKSGVSDVVKYLVRRLSIYNSIGRTDVN